ncbi:RING-H2 group F2A [Striga asiatica]|uniref:RING-H2 group F2A n=1 Tax=Striga asiatica TaxID=4170 RepID=A0A5A7QWQ7_STRAF|nr:RING-H2 group F2A [Striga asiatica]
MLGFGGTTTKEGRITHIWSEAGAFSGSEEEASLRADRWILELAAQQEESVICCCREGKCLAQRLNRKSLCDVSVNAIVDNIYSLVVSLTLVILFLLKNLV